VAAEPGLARRFGLLCSMPGVDAMIAYTLLALLPELSTIGRKLISALIGLASYAFDSGKFKGQRHIYGGRTPAHNVLYMAAFAAFRFNPARHSEPDPRALCCLSGFARVRGLTDPSKDACLRERQRYRRAAPAVAKFFCVCELAHTFRRTAGLTLFESPIIGA
jgi:hypothetical protein